MSNASMEKQILIQFREIAHILLYEIAQNSAKFQTSFCKIRNKIFLETSCREISITLKG
jgi:hypothetical protein